MNTFKIFILFFLFCSVACSSEYEPPEIDIQQPYINDLKNIKNIDDTVRLFASKNGFEVRINKVRQDVLDANDKPHSFSYWLILKNYDSPGINIFSVSEGGYYRLMFFNSGFSSKEELLSYKDKLFEMLIIN